LIELADLVIAPVTRSMLSLRGVLNLRDLVQQSSNRPEIRVLDIELNEWDPELKELLSSDFKFIEPAIRNDVAMVTAQSGGRSTLSLSPQSNAAADYRELTYSLLEEIGLF
jgi:cellulose biosynthesis protein BcsQ